MKINSIYPQSAIDAYTRTQNKTAPVTEKKQAVDKVELNTDAKIFSSCLRAAKESINADALSKEQRVEEIAKALKENTYSVSGRDVARKLLGKGLN